MNHVEDISANNEMKEQSDFMDESTGNCIIELTGTETKTIFIVEDDEAIGKLLVQMIHSETPYHVSVVSNAFQALEYIKLNTPQLLLLDYQLPGMNGIELYDRLRQIPELPQIPVLLMSAYLPTIDAIRRGLETLKKPFDLETLLQMLDKYLA